MAESEEARALDDQASELDQLAEDVELLLNGAQGYITNTMTTWEGPNRDQVEELLGGYATDCVSAAGALRTRATNLRTQADDLDNGNGGGE
jgi:hypothetical protein